MIRTKFTVLLLLLNLGLALAVVHFYRQAQASKSAASATDSATLSAAAGGAAGARPVKIVKTNIVENHAFRWSQVESEDYRAYIERLRAIGCPEQTIRDLVIADIDKLFAPRLHALHPAARELNYWQSDAKELESSADFQDRERQQRQIDFEKREIVRQLLGIDLVSERARVRATEDFSGRRLGFLSDDKRSQVRMLVEHYNAEEVTVRQKTWEEGEALTEDDQARLKLLQQQRDATIAKVLTPTELEQYQLAMSPLAYQVRDSLFGMNANEQEYLALYKLNKEFHDKWPTDVPPTDPQQRNEWEQARAELQAQIKDSLGDSRYAEYRRAQDQDYRELAIAAARYKVPAAVVSEVYGYKQAALEARARVAGNRLIAPDQQANTLQALAAETEATVKGALGEKTYNYYLRTGQGAWIHGAPGP